jgi:multidrug efflux pump subunit AcrA (membrane-fusion protein)
MTRFQQLAPIVLLAACAAVEPPPPGPSPTEATTAKAPVVAPEPEVVYDGVITARNSEVISAPFTGRVKKLDVASGQRIAKNDRLVLIDDKDLRDKIKGLVAQEKAAYSQGGVGGAQAKAARDELAGLQKLKRLGGRVSTMEIMKKQSEIQAHLASGGGAAGQGGVPKAERETLERQLEKAAVLAPVDGIVMNVKTKDGAVVQKDEPIARVYDPKDLIVRFAVPKAHRGKLKKGARVELKIEGVDRKIWASIQTIADEEAPINLTVVVADIDDGKIGPDEVRFHSTAAVRLVDKS